jgi:glycosyltransferase involved in cell wall biosynthesis
MNNKILVDLKPALDGYAGIPQETRLVFACLSQLDNLQVEGLIQHGSHTLKSGLKPDTVIAPAKKINKLGRMVVSVSPSQKLSFAAKLLKQWKNKLSVYPLRLKALLGLKIRLGIFEPHCFQDFIWRSFFSKSLSHTYKDKVTGLGYRVLRPSRQALHLTGLGNRYLGLAPVYLTLKTTGIRFLLAQTPFPARVSKGTTLLVRYHDAVPLLMPHTISDNKLHQASHFHALQDNVRSGAWFICISESSRQDLLMLFPEAASRTVVIYNIISEEFFEGSEDKERVLQIIPNRLGKQDERKVGGISIPVNLSGLQLGFTQDFEYLLAVSTIEPRKNYPLLLEVFEMLKATTHPNLKLVIVGSLGWGYAPILGAFAPLSARGDLFYLSDVPTHELRVLYQHAAATICPSFGEGFGYPGVEAMRCGGVVIASDTPIHREIYADAGVYIDPYNPQHAAKVIAKTLAPHAEGEKLRDRLRTNGKRVSSQYLKENILPQWQAFFDNFPEAIK